MSLFEQIAFNLIINAVCSFAAGVVIVAAVIRVFRIANNRWKLLFLLLPYFKIIWDMRRGIPSSSVLFSGGINALSFPPKGQTLSIGAGFSDLVPVFSFMAFSAKDVSGKTHSTSLADYIAAFLVKYVDPSAPRLVLITMIVTSFLLVSRRICFVAQFNIKRRRQRVNDSSLESIRLRFRTVDLYSSAAYVGTPFTGGFFFPYICIPASTQKQLSKAEVDAVVQHEVAHVRHFDALATFLVKTLGDIFWFIPFYRLLSHRIDRLRELLADQRAQKMGASGAHLASALLKLKKMHTAIDQPMTHSAFLREPSLIKIRVQELLGLGKKLPSRFGWNNSLARILITAWTVGAVMLATLGGNHQIVIEHLR